jgi:hypothetical protein
MAVDRQPAAGVREAVDGVWVTVSPPAAMSEPPTTWAGFVYRRVVWGGREGRVAVPPTSKTLIRIPVLLSTLPLLSAVALVCC